MIKKHESEVGHENIKHCAKEIVKTLVEKEIKKNSEIPHELDKHKSKKIHEFSKIYMEKFLSKYRNKRSKKDQEGGEKRQKLH